MAQGSSEEITRGIYRLEIPLPGMPLKSLNSYVIKGAERPLVVDCGIRRRECLDTMHAGLASLGINPAECDFFITHFHVDHLGLVSDLAAKGAAIYLNRSDAVHVKQPTGHGAFEAGFPPNEIGQVAQAHPGAKYGPQMPLPFSFPEDGQVIRSGRHEFRCVAVPGHSFGHLCLYEEGQKVLLSGDHLLKEITPSIQAWPENWDSPDYWNPLKEYLMSLDRTATLEVAWVLPGHGTIFNDMRARIEELKEHHARRAQEVLTILRGGPRTAYQLASEMTWDIADESFGLFPIHQKWFATGEAIAHLIYLEEMGEVSREKTQENRFLWKA